MDRDEPFSHRYLLLDIDRAEQYPEELADLKKILPKHQEEIVWQKPCGEAIQLATAWIKAPGNRIRLDGTAQAREEYRRVIWHRSLPEGTANGACLSGRIA